MNPELTILGITPPITLLEAKSAKKITTTAEDGAHQRMLDAAVELAQFRTGRSLTLNTYVLRLDNFSDSDFVCNGIIRIPSVPFKTVASIKYYDETDVQQTLSALIYQKDIYSTPGTISLKAGQNWPTVFDKPNAIEIEYTAGYSNVGIDKTPTKVVQAIELMFGKWNLDREDYSSRRLPTSAEILFNTEKFIY